jgi:hypothetical protein
MNHLQTGVLLGQCFPDPSVFLKNIIIEQFIVRQQEKGLDLLGILNITT